MDIPHYRVADYDQLQFTKIVHVSDVHIRLLARHTEYREVFDRFFESIKHLDPKRTIIVNTGDTFHSKLRLSPEATILGSEFLERCARLFPTVVIPGNHDALVSQPQRTDAVWPCVKPLIDAGLPIHYLRKTGVWEFGNLVFHHTSCFDYKQAFIRPIDTDKVKVAVFHGAVTGSKTNKGFVITDAPTSIAEFDEYDIGLFGDIHKVQLLDNNCAYASSLIQQNHGEHLNEHGYLLWDVESRNADFIPVKNDYGFVTIDVDAGGAIMYDVDIPQKPYVRIRTHGCPSGKARKVVSPLLKGKDVQRVTTQDISVVGDLKNTVLTEQRMDPRNTFIQFCKDNYPKEAKRLIALHDVVIREASIEPDLGGIKQWKPLTLTVDGLLSYSEYTEIDFGALSGKIGVFGQNSAGKSSLFDILCFCLFDKTTRAFKGSDVISAGRDTFECSLTFQLAERIYRISRSGRKNKTGAVKVDVSFEDITDGSEINLTGERRDATNAAIREKIGTYEEFTTTVFSPQNGNAGFLDMSNREKRDALSLVMGLSVFSEAYKRVSVMAREKKGVMKEYTSFVDSYEDYVAGLEAELASVGPRRTDLENQIVEAEEDYYRLSDEVKEFDRLYARYDRIPPMSLLEKSLSDHKVDLYKCESEIDTLTFDIETLSESRKSAVSALDGIDIPKVTREFDAYTEASDRHVALQKKLDQRKRKLDSIRERIDGMPTDGYNESCEMCVERKRTDFSELDKLQASESSLENEIAEIEVSLMDTAETERMLSHAPIERTVYLELEDQITKLDRTLSNDRVRLEACMHSKESLMLRIENIEREIEQRSELDAALDAIGGSEESVLELRATVSNKKSEINKLKKEVNRLIQNTGVLKEKIASAKERMSRYVSISEEHSLIDTYRQIVSPAGLPYEISKQLIHKAEDYANGLLSDIVDGDLVIELEDKNVGIYLDRSGSRVPATMFGGMEKFATSLAIRAALSRVLSLTPPSFVIVDEGFGSLDADSMVSVKEMLDVLSNVYDSVFFITHIESMKDASDIVIEVSKGAEEGSSIYIT